MRRIRLLARTRRFYSSPLFVQTRGIFISAISVAFFNQWLS
jgi:hypothetical protein